MTYLRRIDPEAATVSRKPVSPETLSETALIVEEVRLHGEKALREHAERLGDIGPGEPMILERDRLERALESVAGEVRGILDRVVGRIRAFAESQRRTALDLDIEVSGGRAGHNWIPVASVGAYAPGGRYPLPSSVLMTVIPARVAGVDSVWVASPRPTPVTMAAAAIAGADGLLAVGGAQAIAALAFGTITPRCDLVVGPGNRWVTAAKKYLFGEIGIDGLAGPSEILVIADDSADAQLVSADLLAQAEHDDDAVPMLLTTSHALIERVEQEISSQLADLPTSATARRAIENGFCMVVESLEEAAATSNRLGPEHLALHVDDPQEMLGQLTSYGSVFLGRASAEVFADYGVGPNHVLPTGGGARFQSGLSVMTFLRAPTWSRLDDPTLLVDDTVLLARLEGLEAHARAAQLRAGS